MNSNGLTLSNSVTGRVGFVVCREPGRISLYVALPPSRPQPIGSRKQLEPRSRSAVHRDENFVKLTANVPAHYDVDFVYMRYYG